LKPTFGKRGKRGRRRRRGDATVGPLKKGNKVVAPRKEFGKRGGIHQ